MQPALRRHESVHRGHEVRRGDQERHRVARLRVGRGAATRATTSSKLYEFAELLVEKGKAYVDSQSDEEIRENRGTVTDAGHARARIATARVEENLDLLRRMKAGEFPDGAHVLRAKIDMAHPNMIMRDPLLLRIRHAHSLPAGRRVVPLSAVRLRASAVATRSRGSRTRCARSSSRTTTTSTSGSCASAGFERPPEQTEFSRLELDYTVMSKRKLLRLVNEGHRERLGRSAHADDRRHAPSRRDAGRRCAPSARRSASRASRRAPSSRRSSTRSATTSTCACRA